MGFWFFYRKTPHRSGAFHHPELTWLHTAALGWLTREWPAQLAQPSSPCCRLLPPLGHSTGDGNCWRCRQRHRCCRALCSAAARWAQLKISPAALLVAWVGALKTTNLSVSWCSGEFRRSYPLHWEWRIERFRSDPWQVEANRTPPLNRWLVA